MDICVVLWRKENMFWHLLFLFSRFIFLQQVVLIIFYTQQHTIATPIPSTTHLCVQNARAQTLRSGCPTFAHNISQVVEFLEEVCRHCPYEVVPNSAENFEPFAKRAAYLISSRPLSKTDVVLETHDHDLREQGSSSSRPSEGAQQVGNSTSSTTYSA